MTDDNRTHAPKAPKMCQMLAVLALQPREAVGTDTLVRELWGEDAPGNAIRTLQTHVYHARGMLDDARADASARALLVTQAPGYRLDIDDDEVDVLVFERCVRRAQWELTQGSPEAAAKHLGRAQALWRGPMLGNVSVGGVLTGRIAHLEELRIRALELRVETENRLGRYREFLPELRALVNDHPLHEWFHGQLISALHRAGRRGEALQAYQNLYTILKRELGLEPSAELRRLQAEILHVDDRDAVRRRTRKGAASDSAVASLWVNAVAS
ncbi:MULTISPECIES: AfsR/SARP family transcriptional regulator [unclassified Streptomyces]|uniref:AfsR/SARP family transcriptional regulator n=1 Tax=unclassified Streptomyces TaxID=2593676 RepID=UPI002255B834|nr:MULTISPECIES: AfsR/SARP family transcriptional regulator [unclassified Streptomyces]MCX4526348.1 AfsR/SARP family transcriptional regulator [Streptomyces sp. NBC_01551]MCX4543090.1 AfsR/SARP family transcriptional regulator [Streptomyces sp. NBC_01565]